VQLKSEISVKNAEIICVTETWLNETISDSELHVEGYNIFRKDRLTRGGGICCFIKNNIQCVRRVDLENVSNDFNEIIICELRDNINNYNPTYLVIIYRPPNATTDFNVNLRQCLNNISLCKSNMICVMGDLNMPGISWDSLTSNNDCEQDVCDIFDQFNLTQCNKNPSRSSSDNILDIVASNKPNRIGEIKSDVCLVSTDHYELVFDAHLNKLPKVKTLTKRKIYMYNKTNWDEVNYHLESVKLLDIIDEYSNDMDLAWSLWVRTVKDILNKYVPSRYVHVKSAAPWIDADVINLSNKKETARRLAKRSNKEADWSRYKKFNNKLKNLVRVKHNQFLNSCFESIDTNPKRFWSMVSHKSKKGSIPHEVYLENDVAVDPQAKAKLFNEFFHSQFNGKTYEVPLNTRSFINDNLSYMSVSELDVYELLINLDVSKAHGPDGLPAIFYKNCAIAIVPSITQLFNLSLHFGYIPKEWKNANITPIYKKGDKSNVKNYRPVSLLSIIGKVLERCVHHHVYSIIKEDISEYQHGFVPQKSTVTQLIEFYDKVYNLSDNKKQCDVVFLDFSKAFDSVPHNLLLAKLQSHGINGRLLRWFNNYLSNRRQRVVIENCSSEYKGVISGVPQGSILGPLLFIIFIDDIIKYVKEGPQLYMYADDTKVLQCINSVHDCLVLQRALDALFTWSLKWGMKFNVSKCAVVSFSNCKQKLIYDYKINGQSIERSFSYVDLGVTVSDDLRWDKHIDATVKKANMRLGLIKRCISYTCLTQVKILCYKSLVRPILESSSGCWSCTNKKQLNKLEGVQRRATQFILNDFHSDYDVRLTKCNLLPLSLRRDFLDCVLLYNYIHNLSNIQLNVTFMENIDHTNRRHVDDSMLSFKPFNTIKYGRFYTNRIVRSWNAIPKDIRQMELSEAGYNSPFKAKLKDWLLEFFTENFNVHNSCTWLLFCGCSACKVV
jgi:hypothetical protein